MPKPAIALPPTELLKSLIDYDPETGSFVWVRTGAPCARPSSNGYLNVWVSGRSYLAHRLAWALTHGELSPSNHVDHINGNKRDNRLSNLRLADTRSNRWNSATRKDSATGHKCVRFVDGVYRVRIHRGGKCRFDKSFKTLEKALAAYERAIVAMDGFYANSGEFLEREETVRAVADSFSRWRQRRMAA